MYWHLLSHSRYTHALPYTNIHMYLLICLLMYLNIYLNTYIKHIYIYLCIFAHIYSKVFLSVKILLSLIILQVYVSFEITFAYWTTKTRLFKIWLQMERYNWIIQGSKYSSHIHLNASFKNFYKQLLISRKLEQSDNNMVFSYWFIIMAWSERRRISLWQIH